MTVAERVAETGTTPRESRWRRFRRSLAESFARWGDTMAASGPNQTWSGSQDVARRVGNGTSPISQDYKR